MKKERKVDGELTVHVSCGTFMYFFGMLIVFAQLVQIRIEEWHARHGCASCVIARSEFRDGVRVLTTRRSR